LLLLPFAGIGGVRALQQGAFAHTAQGGDHFESRDLGEKIG
jgi:hypothetical protein